MSLTLVRQMQIIARPAATCENVVSVLSILSRLGGSTPIRRLLSVWDWLMPLSPTYRFAPCQAGPQLKTALTARVQRRTAIANSRCASEDADCINDTSVSALSALQSRTLHRCATRQSSQANDHLRRNIWLSLWCQIEQQQHFRQDVLQLLIGTVHVQNPLKQFH